MPEVEQERAFPVGFDCSFDRGIDQVLALGLWLGLGVNGKILLSTCTVSRYDFDAAVFCDLMANFYFPKRNLGIDPSSGQNTVGLTTRDKPFESPVLSQIGKKRNTEGQLIYPRNVAELADTAEPAVLLRNQMYLDVGARLVMLGPPTNLLDLLKFSGTAEIIKKQIDLLVVAAGRFGAGRPDSVTAQYAMGLRELFAVWPTPIMFVGAEIGEAIRYPASSIERDYSWAPSHPVVDAYRAYGRMPYDATTQAMAAVLYVAQPAAGYFQISDPGTVTVQGDGSTTFASSAEGKHRYLIADLKQAERVQAVYTQATSVDSRPKKEDSRKAAGITNLNAAQHGITRAGFLLLLALIAGIALLGLPKPVFGQDAGSFDQLVKPTLAVCAQCHNSRLVTGGLDVSKLNSQESILGSRGVWEYMIRRIRSGEMPPPGVPRPSPQQLAGMADFVEGLWRRADSLAAPDPGRVAMHRLNRTEYANTVRDLLGLRFRADRDFPADDSGGGFDTIGDLLTTSPALAERYFAVAERLARWALSAEVPPEPLTYHFSEKDDAFRFIDLTMVEAEHRVDYSGEYTVRVGMQGARPNDSPPVKLGFWLDGQLIYTGMVETKGYDPNNTYPETFKEFRAFVPAGDHVFRSSFIDDDYLKVKAPEFVYEEHNKYLVSLELAGPSRSTKESDSRKRILTCDLNGRPECVRQIIGDLARRAYRREVSEAEIQSLMRFPALARTAGKSAEEGIQMALQAILVSPSFLYRVEHDAEPSSSAAAHRISDFDLASRLSYFLWSSMPDDQLLDLAEAGQLSKPDVLRTQVDRMVADPKASEFAANFAGQWLETRNLSSASPDPAKFPQWSPALRDAMRAETTLFFEYLLRENRPITDFLDADYTFLNDTLAEHYGIEGVSGPEFRRVDLRGLAARSQRGGILGQAGVLTVSSYHNRTSPVLRGKYVLQNILGTPPPPPPPNVPRLDEKTIGVEKSMREQLEEHRNKPQCATCHSRMDPLGFGLENYDAIGRWRTQDGKFAVDSKGKLPDGTTFESPAELRQVLTRQIPQFSRNLIEKLLTYASGRGLESYDRPTVDQLLRNLERNDYRFKPLIYSIVESLPFQYRRKEEITASTQ